MLDFLYLKLCAAVEHVLIDESLRVNQIKLASGNYTKRIVIT